MLRIEEGCVALLISRGSEGALARLSGVGSGRLRWRALPLALLRGEASRSQVQVTVRVIA